MKTFALVSTIALTSCVMLHPTSTYAQTFVDWSGNYVSGNQSGQLTESHQIGDFGGGSGGNDTREYAISLTGTPFSPVVGPNYSGTSDTFYGGSETIIFDGNSDPANPNYGYGNSVIQNSGATDYLESTNGDPSGTVNESTTLVLWRDFIGGGSYDVGGLTSFSVTTPGYQAALHWVVEVNGTYYTSESFSPDFIFETPSTLTTFTGTDEWAVYNPTGATLYPGTLDYDQTLSSTGSVEAVGLLYAVANDTSGSGISISQFSADGTPIDVPEPSSMALLAMGFGGLFLFLRRKPC